MPSVDFGIESSMYRDYNNRQYEDFVQKAYITGQDIVTPTNDGDASALRPQFLMNNLVNTLYGMDLAITMKKIPVTKVSGPLVEFSRIDMIGGAGDTFVGETGDGSFGVSNGEDAWSRHTRTVKYLATQRQVGDIAAHTNNLEDLKKLSRENATLELIRNANIALFWGHSGLNSLQYDGIEKQIMDYVLDSNDGEILVDMNNTTIGIEEIKVGAAISARRFGNPSVLIQSINAHHATEQTVWQQLRGDLRSGNGTWSNSVDKVETHVGPIKLRTDIMLRENRPGQFNGPAALGLPNLTADTGAWNFAVTPFDAAALNFGARAAGSGYYYDNRTLSTQSAAPAVPAVPTATGQNNASNRNAAGTYYYALEAVYKGKRSVAWVYGAASAGTFAGPTGITITAGQIVQINLKAAATAFGASYVAAELNKVSFRLYRTAALASVPTAWNQFGLLDCFSYQSATVGVYYDNGFKIPGTGTGFLLTEKRDGRNSVVFAEFRDMTEKLLAPLALASQFVVTLFGTPIVFFGGHHVLYYNVRATDATAFT
jgi:hypothetical protein